jgi:hypothetical protein
MINPSPAYGEPSAMKLTPKQWAKLDRVMGSKKWADMTEEERALFRQMLDQMVSEGTLRVVGVTA